MAKLPDDVLARGRSLRRVRRNLGSTLNSPVKPVAELSSLAMSAGEGGYRKLGKGELERILTAHAEWLSSEGEAGEQADLQWTNLERAVLREAVLREADLEGADLRGANLEGAELQGADLQGANLTGANLTGANLEGAELRGAILREANLHGANLPGVELQWVIPE